jgi:ribonuclease BN (tRNA processing enzyme)
MRVTFLGTGAGQGSASRSSAGILLESDDAAVMLDCGPGAVTNLSFAGLAAGDIHAILVSHLHADHSAGLWPLFGFAATFAGRRRRATQLPDVIGPHGTIEVVSEAYELASTHARHSGNEPLGPGTASEAPLDGDFELFGFRVQARTTRHAEGLHALCYRVEHAGSVLAYSGDTTPQPQLMSTVAGGADLLIHEAYSARAR